MKVHYYALLFLFFLFSCKKGSNVTPEPVKSSEKKITSFKFLVAGTEVLGVISDSDKSVKVSVPYGVDIKVLHPVILVSEKATVENTTAADFSNPVTYQVIAEDGTKQDYQIYVTVNDPKFSVEPYLGSTFLEAGPGYLLLKGKGFGTVASKVKLILTNTVSLKETKFSTFTSLKDDELGFTIPENFPLAIYNVHLSVDDVALLLPFTLKVLSPTPVIESLNGSILSTTDVLSINGHFFSADPSLIVTLKSKESKYSYVLKYPHKTFLDISSNKIQLPLTDIPAGLYTVQVSLKGLLSTLKDLQVFYQPTQTGEIITIDKSNYTEPYTFRKSDKLKLGVRYVNYDDKVKVKFYPLKGGLVFISDAKITAMGIDGTNIECSLVNVNEGNYKIHIEVGFRDGEPHEQTIKINQSISAL